MVRKYAQHSTLLYSNDANARIYSAVCDVYSMEHDSKRAQCHIEPVTNEGTQSSGVDARIARRGCFRADAGLIDLGFSFAFSLYSSVKSGIFNVILVNFCLNILFSVTISIARG